MIKIIVTLGPATNSLDQIAHIKSKGVDFVRINMSHSSIEDLIHYIELAKEASIPFIIDTEGSQVRTGYLVEQSIFYKENDVINLSKNEILGNTDGFSIKPEGILDQLQEGDILYIDFDTLAIRVSDISTINDGYIKATIISSGHLGSNKGVAIDPKLERKIDMPTLTRKDIEAIEVGISENISHVAASFMRSSEAVQTVRRISQNKMKIISKIECKDALKNLDEIINVSDYLLIDRGDLSKEIPIEQIPFTQKIILQRAKEANKGVYVATNLLESMITNRKPTRSEVHDITDTISEGAYGLTLAAETAIGKHPIACINMLNKIINHAKLAVSTEVIMQQEKKFVSFLDAKNYLEDETVSFSIVQPNGGKLVNRVSQDQKEKVDLESLVKIRLNENQHLDLEQIAIGAYSPLEGFMTKLELESVLNTLHLPDGTIWPMPIILDIDIELAEKIKEGQIVALLNQSDEYVGTIHVKNKYDFDRSLLAKNFFGHNNIQHPGVKIFHSLSPVFLGGPITLFKMKDSRHQKYCLTPKQTRRLFEEKNWSRVVGFHTRNVIHRAHEFIQMQALRKANCDGILLHPVVGKKKTNDYSANVIIRSYETMQKHFYPKDKTLFSVFSTFSRYGGPKEALFTALCRKNYGCSHFIIGRDHTGAKGFEDDDNTVEFFSRFEDIGVEIIKFNNIYFSKSQKTYLEEGDDIDDSDKEDQIHISATEARKMLRECKAPPSWFMRPEISAIVIDAIRANEDVFIK